MDALVITADPGVFAKGSAAAASLHQYETLGKHVMVFVLHTGKKVEPSRLSKTLWLVPIRAPTLFLAALLARHVARRELYFQRKPQVDIIDGRDPFEAGFAALLIARMFKRGLHLHVPAFDRAYTSLSISALLRRALASFTVPQADALTTDSQHMRTALIAMHPSYADRIAFAPHFIDVMALGKGAVHTDLRTKYPQFKIILLTVCPFEPAYDPALAIEVLAEVCKAYSFVGLVMVGQGSLRPKLEFAARAAGVRDKVVFEPWSADLASYYKTAHIFLLTSRNQEFANSIAAAAASSCAIVSSRVGLAQEFLEDNVSAYLCEPGDVECLIQRTITLTTKPEIRERLRLNGLLAAEQYMQRGKSTEHIDVLKGSWERAARHFAEKGSAGF